MARPKKNPAAAVAKTPVTEPSTRKKRIPVGERHVLSVQGKDPNYKYRFVNNVGDRIQQFLDGGYEFVDAKSHRVGDNRVGDASPEGSNAQVNVGGGVKSFLMRIHKDYYDEDQKVKMDKIDKLEKSLVQSPAADYGKVVIDKSGGTGK